jgi:hypothetical protein
MLDPSPTGGHRLDLLAATAHDALAQADYRELARHDIRSARDGLRWHLIETAPGQYDWSSFLPLLRAANSVGTQVIWDLCHYGWPDDIDIWSPEFVDRFARFAREVARLVQQETDAAPLYCPANEISYWAWAGGDEGRINPCTFGRGAELKRQLVRAAIAAMEAIRDVEPRARFITAEPLINVVSPIDDPQLQADAELYRQAQYEAFDMLSGRSNPELGGADRYLDLIGVNYYPENQWWIRGPTIPFGHYAYRPLLGHAGRSARALRAPGADCRDRRGRVRASFVAALRAERSRRGAQPRRARRRRVPVSDP